MPIARPSAVPCTMQISVTRIVICRPRQNSAAYSAMMSARNQPNQSTCSMYDSVRRAYWAGRTGASAWNHFL